MTHSTFICALMLVARFVAELTNRRLAYDREVAAAAKDDERWDERCDERHGAQLRAGRNG